MAKSGKVVITQNSQSVSTNKSSITIRGYITTSGESWRGTHDGLLNITVNGITTSEVFTASAPKNTKNHLIFSKTFTVSHNNMGKCTVKASFNYDDGWVSASISKTLTTIPRASAFGTISGNMLGSSIVVNITRKANYFTHNVYYRVKGESSWININNAVGTSISFIPPLSLATKIPDSTLLQLELLLRTYSGTTKIGSDVTKTITVNLPSSVIPTVNTPILTRVDNGVPSSWGVYVKSYSKVNVNVSGSGIYGSKIKSYEIICNGEKKTNSGVVFGPFNTSGTKSISAVAIDSRGRKSAAKTISITVQDYIKPKLEIVTYRSNSAGTKDSSGTYITIKPTYSCASCGGKNSIIMKNFTAGDKTNTSVASGSFVILSGFDETKEYFVTGVVKDALGNLSSNISIKIPTSNVCFHIRTEKNGIGIGRYCTVENQLQTAYSIKIDRNIFVDSSIYSGGKTSATDGKPGGALGTNGYLHLIADGSKNYPGISFYYDLATSATHQMIARQNDFYFNRPVAVNGTIRINNSTVLGTYNSKGTAGNLIYCANDNRVIIGTSSTDVYGNMDIYAGDFMRFHTNSNSTSYKATALELFREQSDNHRTILRPATNSGAYLGTTTYRFNTAFFTNNITASDLKEKDIIEDFDFKVRDFIMGLEPIAYRRKGQGDTGERIHIGLGAQTLAKHIKDLNLGDLSMVQASIVDGESEKSYHGEDIDDSQLSWGINYTELTPYLILMIKEQQNEINYLKKEIDEIKQMILKQEDK